MSRDVCSVAAPRSCRIGFQDLLAPIRTSRFVLDYWTREALVVRGAARNMRACFGWDAVNSILNARDCAIPEVAVYRNDGASHNAYFPVGAFTRLIGSRQIVDPHTVVQLFRAGASVRLWRAESRWPSLAPLLDCLREALCGSPHTYAFCSPPNQPGFECHYDLDEVFVFQFEGDKHWRVYRPLEEAPVRGWRAGAACALETEPYIDVTLHPGDMLYIPRGHQHYAVSLEKTSLHLAVALSCPKGNCLLSWLAREVFDLPSLRHVPLAVSSGQDTGSLTRVGFSTWSEEMKGAILRSLETANYVDRVRAFCEESVAKSVPVGFP